MSTFIKPLIVFACFFMTFDFSHAQVSASPEKVINEKNVHLIPRSEEDRGAEFTDFKKNWKNKKFIFQGKINRAGGLSLDAYYINGCEVALQGMKFGTLVSVTGNLIARESGGSGGEPIELKNCSINDSNSIKVDATPTIKPNTSVANDTKFGYLTGKIKTFEGNGCEYFLASDDKKKNKKTIGADDFSQSGIILNIDGKDILAKGSIDSKGIFLGAFGTTTLRVITAKSQPYGENGSKSQMSFNLNSSGTVTQTSVVGYCYD